MIVVIDTNVWISALQFAKRRGKPTLVLEKAMSEDLIATCDEIDAEIMRVLTKKFFWEQRRATTYHDAPSVLASCRGTIKPILGSSEEDGQSTLQARWPYNRPAGNLASRSPRRVRVTTDENPCEARGCNQEVTR